MSIGNRLQLLRKSKGLTLEEMQVVIGIHRSQLSAYENNKKNPGAKMLRKLAEFYNVSVDYLISGKEENPQFQISEKVVPYGNDLKEVSEILSDLSPEARRKQIEILTVLAKDAREKERLAKKKSGAG